MRIQIIGVSLCILFFSCSANKKINKQPTIHRHFSIDNLDPDEIYKLYEGVPTYASMYIVKYFVDELEMPEIDVGKNLWISDEVVLRPLIDERGEIEAILNMKSVNPLVDKAIVNSILSSKFNLLHDVTGYAGKYSLILLFSFPAGKISQGYYISYPKNICDKWPRPVNGFTAIEKNLELPTLALENQVEGEVILRFQVNKDGSTKKHEVLLSPGFGLGRAAINAVKSLEWIPGKRRNKKVESRLTIPIVFKLQRGQ